MLTCVTDVQGGWDSGANQVITVSVQWYDQTMVVAVGGEIDMITAPQLDEALTQALLERPDVLVVDVLKVAFLASVGLSVLITVHQRAGADTRLRVVADGAATGRPLRLTGLDQQFPVFATLEQALAAN